MLLCKDALDSNNLEFPMTTEGLCACMQLDAKTGEVISSDADPAIQFKEIGRDKGSFRIDANNTVNYDRVIGSTIGLRSACIRSPLQTCLLNIS